MHLLDQETIRTIGAFDRIDATALLAFDNKRIDRSVADRLQRLLGFFEPAAKLRVLGFQTFSGLLGPCGQL